MKFRIENGEGNEAGVVSALAKFVIVWLASLALLGSVPGAAQRSSVLPDGPFIEDMSRAIVPPPPPPPPDRCNCSVGNQPENARDVWTMAAH